MCERKRTAARKGARISDRQGEGETETETDRRGRKHA